MPWRAFTKQSPRLPEAAREQGNDQHIPQVRDPFYVTDSISTETINTLTSWRLGKEKNSVLSGKAWFRLYLAFPQVVWPHRPFNSQCHCQAGWVERKVDQSLRPAELCQNLPQDRRWGSKFLQSGWQWVLILSLTSLLQPRSPGFYDNPQHSQKMICPFTDGDQSKMSINWPEIW